MNLDLLVLSFAACALVAAAVSALLYLLLPVADRIASTLGERHRVVFWLGLASLPTAIGALAVAASFLPAWGIGSDHCLTHGAHHLHLCPEHLAGAPGLVLSLLAATVVLRALWGLGRLGRTTWLSFRTATSLVQGSRARGEVFVFGSDVPEAFVLGLLKPRIFVSQGLVDLEDETSELVLAHEYVHAAHRDALWRAVFPLLALGHLPPMVDRLFARLVAAQEFSADAEGASAMDDGRLKMADALLALARMRRASSVGLSFTDGHVEARVAALVQSRATVSVWPARLLVLGALAVPLLLGASYDSIHHELETLLGALR